MHKLYANDPLGSVQNNTYQYDALSNLQSRSDLNTGVAETFAYDNLNRLFTYTVLGGAVSPPTTIDTRYDPRGWRRARLMHLRASIPS